MTQQEQQLLSGLIQRVNGTQLASKDSEAENLLNSAFQRNPDAVYILCQTVLVQQLAMDNAQRQLIAARAEIDSLKARPEQHGSFLGNLFGLGKGDDAPAQPAPPPPSANLASAPTGYAPVHNPAAPPYGYAQQPPPPGYGYGGGGYPQPGYGGPIGGGGGMIGGGGMFGGGGGFLQSAMQTAAGVVAGEFAFRAIEDVFHGFGGGGGGRGFGGGSEVVNNYYDSDSSSHDGSSFGDRLQSADNLGSGISPDIEDRRGESRGFLNGNDSGDAPAFVDDNGDDSSNYADDSGSDDSGSDDSGSDDSGGSDNGF